MTTRQLAIRLKAEDGDKVVAALRGLGSEGERAARRIESSMRKASTGTRALNGAAQEVRGELQGLASRAGPLGTSISGLGAAGFAAAAGIGALTLGLTKAIAISREAIVEFDGIAKAADRAGVSTDFLQELNLAIELSGGNAGGAAELIAQFATRLGQAREGTGEMVTALRAANPEIARQIVEVSSVEQALDLYLQAMAGARTEQDRLRLASAAFGETLGRNLVVGLKDGVAGLQEMRESARDLGLVIDEELLRRAEDLNDELTILRKQIDVNLKTAFVDLAPAIIKATELMRDFSAEVNELSVNVRLAVGDGSGLATSVLEESLERYQADLEDLLSGNRVERFVQGATIDTTERRIERIIAELERRRRDSLLSAPSGDDILDALFSEAPNGGSGGGRSGRARSRSSRTTGTAATRLPPITDVFDLPQDFIPGIRSGVPIGPPPVDLINPDAADAAAEALRDVREEIENMTQAAEDFGRGVAGDVTDALKDVVRGTEGAFRDLGLRIADRLLEEAFRPVEQAIANFFADVAADIASAFASRFASNIFPSANGNAFSGGNPVPFANGGAFGGRVVSQPELFPMRDGRTGLMGEAGPEAILPLLRDAQGRLGVSSPSGRPMNVSVNLYGDEARRAVTNEAVFARQVARAIDRAGRFN